MIDPVDMQALADLANEFGNEQIRKRGFRMDAVFYCLSCLEKIKGKNIHFLNSLILELGRKGLSGFQFDQSGYTIDCIQMTNVTGFCMSCYLYCVAKALGIDSGLAISDEYALACKMLAMQNNDTPRPV